MASVRALFGKAGLSQTKMEPEAGAVDRLQDLDFEAGEKFSQKIDRATNLSEVERWASVVSGSVGWSLGCSARIDRRAGDERDSMHSAVEQPEAEVDGHCTVANALEARRKLGEVATSDGWLRAVFTAGRCRLHRPALGQER